MTSNRPLPVCRLQEIEDPGARGFTFGPAERPREGFVVRRGERAWAWLNVCPHAGRNLNWKPDAFLTRDRSLIMCSAHGAVFEPDTGLCVGGPCPGRRLTPIPCEILDGVVVVSPGGD